MGKLVLSFAFVIVCSFPLSAQIDSGSKHYLTDFRLTINETTYSFVDSYMINVRADTSLVRRRSYRYGFSTNDLNAIYFRDGSHVLLGLAIGGGLGIAVGTWIFMELAGGGGGHPGIYFPPVLIAVPLGLLVT